jgi:hypothetical protein
MIDRFQLEDEISALGDVVGELETLLFKIGDSPTRPSEDEIMNMIIGMISLQNTRLERANQTFEHLVKDSKIV